MIKKILITISALVLSLNSASASVELDNSSLLFDSSDYFYRWSNADMHEFTPKGQAVDGEWEDMLTINYYKDVSDKPSLAEVAGAVLANYQEAGGIILGVDAVSAGDEDPSEYIMAVVFGATNIAEFAFVRFKIKDGMGVSLAYAHREYGENVGEQIDRWMQ